MDREDSFLIVKLLRFLQGIILPVGFLWVFPHQQQNWALHSSDCSKIQWATLKTGKQMSK